jgi:hypothetical protein
VLPDSEIVKLILTRRKIVRAAKPREHLPGWAVFLHNEKRVNPMLGTILLIVLILLLVGALPSWPYSSGWGYGPSGVLGTVVVVLLILVLIGRI